MRIRMSHVLAAAVLAAVAVPSLAEAQQTTRRRQAPITIRGTVPTPQVVTVRPREVPAYSRNVLVPNFYDRDFWAVILPAYLVVPERMVTGEAPVAWLADSAAAGAPPAGAAMGAPADSAGVALPALPPRPSRPFARPAAPAPSGATPAGASGTAPASPTR